MIHGDRLRTIRQERGLSQAALGQRVGLDAQYIFKLEHGKRRDMTTRTLERLVQALQVSADYLLGLSEVVQVATPAPNSAPPRPRPRRGARVPGRAGTSAPAQQEPTPMAMVHPPDPPQPARPAQPLLCPHCGIPLQPLAGLLGLGCSACRYRREEA
jgi:transcriptional regulator with XRE-family HTH domain